MNSLERNPAEIVNEIEKLISDEMNKAIEWYGRHTDGPRLFFRLLGMLTIFLSVAIPFISQDALHIENKSLLITFMSLSITAVTGLVSFYKPDQTWKINMGAKLNLEGLYTSWKLEMMEAKSTSDESKTIEKCVGVSRRLLEAAQNVTASNTEGFFANVKFPVK